jgi:hypothetical protein
LGHSTVPGAVMDGADDHAARALTPDDIAGICALYPGDGDPPCTGQDCELPRSGPRNLGADCQLDTDCAEHVCLDAGGDAYCTRACTIRSDCPLDYDCAGPELAPVCVRKPPSPERCTEVGCRSEPTAHTGGCSLSTRAARYPHSRDALSFAALVVAFTYRKRRRRNASTLRM